MWVPPEAKDPILQLHPTRRSVGYFGAVRLRDWKFWFRRETDKFNAATFFEFMRGLRRVSINQHRPPRRSDYGPRQVPLRPPAQGLARAAYRRLRTGLFTAL